MMDSEKIKAWLDGLEQARGPHKDFPLSFVEYPQVDQLLASIVLLIAVARASLNASKEASSTHLYSIPGTLFMEIDEALTALVEGER